MEIEFLKPKSPHYYGDFVRVLFLAAAVVLMVGVPVYPEIFPFDILSNVIFILVIGLLAGITNPRQYWIANVNTVVSALSLIVFEYYAVADSEMLRSLDVPFFAKQLLALIFFFALYYSVKTSRAEYLAHKLPPA